MNTPDEEDGRPSNRNSQNSRAGLLKRFLKKAWKKMRGENIEAYDSDGEISHLNQGGKSIFLNVFYACVKGFRVVRLSEDKMDDVRYEI